MSDVDKQPTTGMASAPESRQNGRLQTPLALLIAAVMLLAIVLVTLLYRRVRETHQKLAASHVQLQAQSERDPLTNLANRRHFQAVMRQLAADGKLNGTVFLIDIDHFKNINDRHGHVAGDAVLVEVARRLREGTMHSTVARIPSGTASPAKSQMTVRSLSSV